MRKMFESARLSNASNDSSLESGVGLRGGGPEKPLDASSCLFSGDTAGAIFLAVTGVAVELGFWASEAVGCNILDLGASSVGFGLPF